MKKFESLLMICISILSLFESSCTKMEIEKPIDPSSLDDIEKTINYEPDVQNIISKNCIACHAGSSPVAGLRLTTYQDVKFTAETGKLLQRINDVSNPMPPTGLLSAKDRQIIEKWIQDGYLEN